MTTTTDTPVLEHRIGAAGRLVVQLETSDLRLRAVDGETVRVFADGSFDETVRIARGPDSLELRENRGGFLRRDRHPGDLIVEVPRGADVDVEDAAGDVAADGLTGVQRYRVVTGDLTIRNSSGALSLEAISGDVDLTAVRSVALTARTVSGDLRVRAAEVTALAAATTSGDIRLAGHLTGRGSFGIKTISGDATLALAGDVVVEVQAATGSVRTDVGGSSAKGRDGRRTVTLGKGGPTLVVQTLSGDVRLVPPVAIRVPIPPARPDPRLDILRALERGDLDPAEAGSRLDALDALEVAAPSTSTITHQETIR